MATVEGRARRGAELLDSREPGWAERVDVDDFDDVLAALYGTYADGLRALFDDPYDGEEWGFTEAQADWLASAAAWRAEVLSRQVRADVMIGGPMP